MVKTPSMVLIPMLKPIPRLVPAPLWSRLRLWLFWPASNLDSNSSKIWNHITLTPFHSRPRARSFRSAPKSPIAPEVFIRGNRGFQGRCSYNNPSFRTRAFCRAFLSDEIWCNSRSNKFKFLGGLPKFHAWWLASAKLCSWCGVGILDVMSDIFPNSL